MALIYLCGITSWTPEYCVVTKKSSYGKTLWRVHFALKMLKSVESPTNCEISSVSRFMNALNRTVSWTRWKFSTHKVICTVLRYQKSFILVNFTFINKTFDAVACSEILKKLRHFFQEKWRSILKFSVF